MPSRLKIVAFLLLLLAPQTAHAQSALFDGPAAPRERIDPDRPHFPEAATTVGLDRFVLEGGVTWSSKTGDHTVLTAPETLLRAGAFADWFELRLGQSFVSQQQMSGAQDLYLGAKLAVTRQHGWWPALALIPQMMAPTGTPQVSAGAVLPGVNLDLAWEVVDRVGIEMLIANNQVKDSLGAIRHELATGLTGTVQATGSLELFAEWDAYYDFGGLASTAPRHYAVGGLVWFLSNSVAVDARAGLGLNNAADDYLVGAGFAVRF